MKYPIGIQDFRVLREGGYVYVDKTEHIYRIVNGGKYFFLSRPRRFGKSLLLSVMNELYCGSRELFEGLWVEKHWDWAARRRPVIWLKFGSQGVRTMGLEAAIHSMLEGVAKSMGIILREKVYDLKLKELITRADAGPKAVLLIDEYDKPIIDYLDDLPKAEANREILKSFYSVLKDCDPYLELVFITGVSAFSKVSIFSDLNNLKNLSLHRHADTLLGITPDELERYFMPALEDIAKYHNTSPESLYEQVQRWYNGYSWNGRDKLYTPFSLLNFLDGKQFRNFWFETGTPTFLLKELRKQRYYDLNRQPASELILNEFDFENLHPITVLFQTGYLTITQGPDRTGLYHLGYPNQEVKSAFQERLLNVYAQDRRKEASIRVSRLLHALEDNQLETVMAIINATFAGLPYEHWRQENEHLFHAIVHLTFSLLGAYIYSEVHTAKGRCDALVQTDRYIYAFEFKLDRSADEALRQIREKGYLAPYADSPKEKIAVGVNFSKKNKQIAEWAAESIA